MCVCARYLTAIRLIRVAPHAVFVQRHRVVRRTHYTSLFANSERRDAQSSLRRMQTLLTNRRARSQHMSDIRQRVSLIYIRYDVQTTHVTRLRVYEICDELAVREHVPKNFAVEQRSSINYTACRRFCNVVFRQDDANDKISWVCV